VYVVAIRGLAEGLKIRGSLNPADGLHEKTEPPDAVMMVENPRHTSDGGLTLTVGKGST
jgi:hypothetical protein